MTPILAAAASERAELIVFIVLAPVPAGAKPPPHVDAEDGPPTIARYGPQASLSQESVEPVWALLRQQETRQADRDLPDDEAVAK